MKASLAGQILNRLAQRRRKAGPQKPVATKGRSADLLKQFHAGSTGRGFTSPTPSRGAGPPKNAPPRPWPRHDALEPKLGEQD